MRTPIWVIWLTRLKLIIQQDVKKSIRAKLFWRRFSSIPKLPVSQYRPLPAWCIDWPSLPRGMTGYQARDNVACTLETDSIGALAVFVSEKRRLECISSIGGRLSRTLSGLVPVRIRMVVAPSPVVFLFVLPQFVVVAVPLVTVVPIPPVSKVLVMIPSMPVVVIVIVDTHTSGTTRTRNGNQETCSKKS